MAVTQQPPNVDIRKNVEKAKDHAINISIMSNLRDASLLSRNAANGTWFYSKVTYGGDWDYKKYNNDLYQDYGNWHYGVVGSAAGYPAVVVQLGAGLAQQKRNIDRRNEGLEEIPTSPFSFFDAVDSSGFSRDQFWLKDGISDYSSQTYY